jgi:serine/threonine protein kinase/Tfp pilus assembly protein PilF
MEGAEVSADRGEQPLKARAVPPVRGTLEVALAPTEKPGDMIGRYHLLQQIGEGGFGVVYMAQQQEPVRRRVALKIVKLGMDTRQVVTRFEAERQALAMMDHPNIARMLDAGATETGRPYFVMELVKGIRITEYCDQNHLSPRERLALFIQICHAVEHAHQKGIIHRDLKPSNILVTLHDGVPVPKIIDFGIAKATQQELTEQTVFTQFGQFIGTPAYMSPEQAEMSGLDIDTRADIYSLGVLLYELLTGTTPFDSRQLLAAGLEAMRRTLREQEPAKPSTRLSTLAAAQLTTAARDRRLDIPKLLKLLRGDLDWIVMKCLEKDRTRRYQTASSFAEDLERFLKNEPISARPPSRLYKLQRIIRRNQVAVTASTLVAFAVVFAGAVATWSYLGQREARNRSDELARFMKDMLESIKPSISSGRDTQLLRDVLDQAVDRLRNNLKGQPLAQARLFNTMGETYRDIADYRKAEQMHGEALAFLGKPTGVKRAVAADALNGLSLALYYLDRLPEAETRQNEALTLRRAVNGPEHPMVAMALNNLGMILRKEGRPADALALHERALAMQRKLYTTNNLAIATTLNHLGQTLRDQRQYDLAEKNLRQSWEIHRDSKGETNALTITALDSLAFALIDLKRPKEAETLELDSLRTHQRVFGTNHPAVASSLRVLGRAYAAQDKFPEAEQRYQEALELRRQSGEENLAVATLHDDLAQVLRRQKRWPEAETNLVAALRVRRRNLPEQYPVAVSLYNLGMLYADEGKLPEADQALNESLALQKKLEHQDDGVAQTLKDLATVLDRENKTEAIIKRNERLMLLEKLYGAQSQEVAAARAEFVRMYPPAGPSVHAPVSTNPPPRSVATNPSGPAPYHGPADSVKPAPPQAQEAKPK